MKKGKVYIVGAGPGNPDLLTLRAINCLKKADIVLHDRLISKDVLSLYAPHAKLKYVGKKASFHTLEQDEIENLLVKLAKKGHRVVRLKGGDPFIFGRGAEEAEKLAKNGISFEIVPGISSALAVPLYAGVPLTHRKHTAGIAIVTGHENPTKGKNPYQRGKEREASSWVNWKALAQLGTVVFLMGIGNLRSNMKMLKKHGKKGATPVSVIRWGSLGKQKSIRGTIDTIADIANKKEMKAPAVVVVGGVAALSTKINWFEKLPLFGKTYLITRSVESNLEMAAKLYEKGAHVISWPSFIYKETRTTTKIKTQLKKIKNYDWLIFTSPRSVHYFLKKYSKIHADYRPLMNVKMAAIGKETAAALKEKNLWVDLIPVKKSSEGLAEEGAFRKKKTLNIFIPQAEDARQEFYLTHRLRHKIFATTFYKKVRIKQESHDVEKIQEKKIDYILFYSPSAVHSFLNNFRRREGVEVLKNAHVMVKGRTTKKALKTIEPSIKTSPIVI